MMTGRFVYLKERGMMQPQKWPDEGLSNHSVFQVKSAEHRLSEEEYALDIEALKRKYPPPDAVGEVLGPWDD